MNSVEEKLNTLIAAYNKSVKGIDNAATMSKDRAYGGIIRAGKGKLVESLASRLVQIAWVDVLHQSPSRMEINKKKIPIYIKDDYIARISDPKVKDYVISHRDKLVYKFSTDAQVFIDQRLVLPIECKAYTENAIKENPV